MPIFEKLRYHWFEVVREEIGGPESIRAFYNDTYVDLSIATLLTYAGPSLSTVLYDPKSYEVVDKGPKDGVYVRVQHYLVGQPPKDIEVRYLVGRWFYMKKVEYEHSLNPFG